MFVLKKILLQYFVKIYKNVCVMKGSVGAKSVNQRYTKFIAKSSFEPVSYLSEQHISLKLYFYIKKIKLAEIQNKF